LFLLVNLHVQDDRLHASIAGHVGLDPYRIVIVALPEMRLVGVIMNLAVRRILLLGSTGEV
jgi:hypothetical protein